MEKEFGSWFLHQYSNRELPNLNSFDAPLDLGQQNTIPAYMNCFANTVSTNEVSTNGNLPVFTFSGLPHSKASQPNEPRGWFYCLPRFRHAFAPVPNSVQKEKLTDVNANCRAEAPNVGSGCAQKRFLVFDQSGDQTTLIFSSGTGTPVQCPTSWNPKPVGADDLNKGEQGTRRETIYRSDPFLTSDYTEENLRDDVSSEMHEDTEELNALLYSDDDYSEDGEETSTGHSPSTMTADDKQEENGEEVASYTRPLKRQKLLDTANSVKPYGCSEYKDDSESSCGDGKNKVLGELGSLSGNERLRKEKIRETVSVLKSIVPGGKGKDSIMIIDEAINYLKSLKLKAKALGLGTL